MIIDNHTIISSNSDIGVEIRLGNKDVKLLNSLDQYSIFKFGDNDFIATLKFAFINSHI